MVRTKSEDSPTSGSLSPKLMRATRNQGGKADGSDIHICVLCLKALMNNAVSDKVLEQSSCYYAMHITNRVLEKLEICNKIFPFCFQHGFAAVMKDPAAISCMALSMFYGTNRYCEYFYNVIRSIFVIIIELQSLSLNYWQLCA